MSTWRTLATAGLIAVGGTAALAASVGAAPAIGAGRSVDHAAPAATTTLAGPMPAASGGASSATAPPGVLVDAPSSQQLTQQVHLNVVGGALELAEDRVVVVLERVPGTRGDFVGALPPVRVVDARGTLEGWSVRWTVVDVRLEEGQSARHVPGAKVHLDPDDPTVVDGAPEGLVAGRPGPAVLKGRTLFGAVAGSGGGTYQVSGALSIRLPGNLHAGSVTVELAFELA